MKICILTSTFLWLVSGAMAQMYEFQSPVTSGLGLSGAGDTTAWSFFTNPSGFSEPVSATTGIGYHDAYGLSDLSAKAAFAYLPTSLIIASAGYTHYGNPHFNLQQISAGASRKISPHLHMGVRFGYMLRAIYGEESRGTFLLDAGLRIMPVSRLMIGFMTQNPGRAKIVSNDTEQPLPSSLALALTWRVSPLFSTTADLIHRSYGVPQRYALGMEVQVHPRLVARGAVSGKPVRLAIGLGLQWHRFNFDVSVNHHDPLGFSSSAGIYYVFGER